MNKIVLSCIIFYMMIYCGSFCYGADYWSFVDHRLCATHGWEYKYQKYEYGITYPWSVPNNIEVDGQIYDDRRCRVANDGTHTRRKTYSQGYTVERAHSWGTSSTLAWGLIGLSGSHTDSTSWACNLQESTTEIDNIAYSSPAGKEGYHDIQWNVSGCEYEGDIWEGWFNTGANPPSDPLHGGLTMISMDVPIIDKSRSVYVSAGDWHTNTSTCLCSRGGCDTVGMTCDGETTCTHSGCPHND